ncbi:hypothetical protein JOF48_000009 [Arthrobacter stackebrandtii]|uniref:DUF559 domain-containing protein n=1 Tax=Arthrobacter stackebrandtii TaxID=272161 RepID=A0ABS4YRJ6_9MICC|nr:hypothetical protein [Arthrobacter stackebrandtii]MBP2411210.1 hypothetical protein [Arthrobacter stackebrandtii]PYH00052.1 hypothetical protein CVV67_11415 [Arthrobacter stackebrandtii]
MRRKQLPQHLSRRSFGIQASDDAGVPRGRTRASDLIVVSRGIRMPAGVPLKGAAALAAYTEASPLSVLSHTSAARLWGIPLPAAAESDWRIHLANPTAAGAPRRVNVVGHRLSFAPGECCEIEGVRLTSPARTWLDLAACLSMRDLVAAGDFLVCSHGYDFPYPKDSICTAGDLADAVRRHPGMRGLRRAREALELIRVGADSPPETFMRLAIVDAGLPEPELNVIVSCEQGIPRLWPDGAYRKYRIGLQYEGAHHNMPGQYQRDIRRLDMSRALGWEEIRLSREDLRGDRPAVVDKVAASLRAKGWEPR